MAFRDLREFIAKLEEIGELQRINYILKIAVQHFGQVVYREFDAVVRNAAGA